MSIHLKCILNSSSNINEIQSNVNKIITNTDKTQIKTNTTGIINSLIISSHRLNQNDNENNNNKDIKDIYKDFLLFCPNLECKEKYSYSSYIDNHYNKHINNKKNEIFCSCCKKNLDNEPNKEKCTKCGKYACMERLGYKPFNSDFYEILKKSETEKIVKAVIFKPKNCLRKCMICLSFYCEGCLDFRNFSFFICESCREKEENICEKCKTKPAKSICEICGEKLCEKCMKFSDKYGRVYCLKDEKYICNYNNNDNNGKANVDSNQKSTDNKNENKILISIRKKNVKINPKNNSILKLKKTHKLRLRLRKDNPFKDIDIIKNMCSICNDYIGIIKCSICNIFICSFCADLCDKCDKTICRKCIRFCNVCKKIVCLSCSLSCSCPPNSAPVFCISCELSWKCAAPGCEAGLCSLCVLTCNHCEDQLCREHALFCAQCEENMCRFHWRVCKVCGEDFAKGRKGEENEEGINKNKVNNINEIKDKSDESNEHGKSFYVNSYCDRNKDKHQIKNIKINSNINNNNNEIRDYTAINSSKNEYFKHKNDIENIKTNRNISHNISFYMRNEDIEINEFPETKNEFDIQTNLNKINEYILNNNMINEIDDNSESESNNNSNNSKQNNEINNKNKPSNKIGINSYKYLAEKYDNKLKISSKIVNNTTIKKVNTYNENEKLIKVCLKNCVIRCSFCDNEVNIYCKSKNHPEDFVKKYNCKHNICNKCLTRCHICNALLFPCPVCSTKPSFSNFDTDSKELVQHTQNNQCINNSQNSKYPKFILCQFCNSYTCIKCLDKCEYCDGIFCPESHTCAICEKAIDDICLLCLERERSKCAYCEKLVYKGEKSIGMDIIKNVKDDKLKINENKEEKDTEKGEEKEPKEDKEKDIENDIFGECGECKKKFVCSKNCYEKYIRKCFLNKDNNTTVKRKLIDGNEDKGKGLFLRKRYIFNLSRESSIKINKVNNSSINGYTRFNEETNKYIHICYMFWCRDHFGKETIRADLTKIKPLKSVRKGNLSLMRGSSTDERDSIKNYNKNVFYSKLLRNSSLNSNNYFRRRNTNLSTVGMNCGNCIII